MQSGIPASAAWLAVSRPMRAGSASPAQRLAGEGPGESVRQMKAEFSLLENSLLLTEAGLCFSLLRPLMDWVKSTYIMKGNLLDPKSIHLNVILIWKHLSKWHVNSSSHHPSSHPNPILGLGSWMPPLILSVWYHFCHSYIECFGYDLTSSWHWQQDYSFLWSSCYTSIL